MARPGCEKEALHEEEREHCVEEQAMLVQVVGVEYNIGEVVTALSLQTTTLVWVLTGVGVEQAGIVHGKGSARREVHDW